MQKKVIQYENKKWIIHNKIVESHLQKLQCFLKNDNKIDNSILLKKESERSSFIYNNLDENYFVKTYTFRRPLKILKNYFRLSHAEKALNISSAMLAAGINVATPLAVLIYKQNFFLKDSMLITEMLKGQNLQEYLVNEKYDLKLKRTIIQKIADSFAKLYIHNFITTDPNLPGIMVHIENDKINVAFVDMDNFKKKCIEKKKDILVNIANFNAHTYSGLARINQNHLVTNTDRLFFINHVFQYLNKYQITKNDIKFIRTQTLKILEKWGRLPFIRF